MSATHLLEAYRRGIFPWFEPGSPILWWSPDPRLLLYPDQFKLSRSLKKSLKSPYQFKLDTHFREVIHACASFSGRSNKTWITQDMQEAYCELHRLGFAHSIEIWLDENLIGGLYGISLGRAFFGESMFHQTRDASKIALFHLCQTLQSWQFDFIDCQLPTPHLMSLGAVIIPRSDFLSQLEKALAFPTRQGSWDHSHLYP